MPLTSGSRFGAYEIVSPLGAGGMGEVYRASDSRLKRQVALKILPAGLASDADRLARFQREAELLAALNHPHIAAIYGIEETDGVKGLVMELVDGPTLAELIATSSIPIADALPIAKQIASSARSGARTRHRPSRSETREHQGEAGWNGEGPRLRPREERRRPARGIA